MTIEEIRQRIAEIDTLDSELAHGAEDSLWEDVLEVIARGDATDPAALAREALQSRELSFSRWYA